MEAKDISTKIDQAEKRLASYYKKLDGDFQLWDLKEVKYERYETAINVTTNEPRLFADDVQTNLASAEMQIIVRALEEEGTDERTQSGKLERLFEFLFSMADERLVDLILPVLKENLIWLFSVRGAAGARILNYIKDGKLVPDYMALDPRWVSYDVGGNGFSWIANKVFKTKSALEDEWGYTPKGISFFTPWVKEKEFYPTYDYWELDKGKAVNSVLCDGEVIHEQKYENLTKLPFLFMPVTSRMPIVTPDNSETGRYGESIFASKRAMYELSNKLASTWATHARILANQPLLNYIDDESLRIDTTTMFAEGILNLSRGHQEILASPLKEISPTLVNLVGWVEDKIARGQTPNLKLGTPPSSGTALNLYREAGNKIFDPQTRILSRFYEGMCRMIEEQLKAGGIGGDKIKKISIQSEKEGKYFAFDMKPVDLKKPHTIKVEFTVKTPWSQLDVAQLADMLIRQGLPRRWVWEFVLKVPDPKLMEELATLEMAENSPILAMKKAVEVLMKYDDVVAAEALQREMDRRENQDAMAAGQVMPPGQVSPAPMGETAPPEQAGTTLPLGTPGMGGM